MTALIKLQSLFDRSDAEETAVSPLFEKEGAGGFPEVRGHRRRRKSPLAPLFQRGELIRQKKEKSRRSCSFISAVIDIIGSVEFNRNINLEFVFPLREKVVRGI
jgi:hypothetical protein